LIQAAETLVPTLGIVAACEAVGLPRGNYYRAQQPIELVAPSPVPERPPSPRALTPTEKATVREVLNSERFQDQAPREVYATLLDEERYLCSWRTMYRILAGNQEIRERRDQLQHPVYAKPELLAMRPNQVWSWDITKLRGPVLWTYYYLYVILDVYSRYVVGWLIAERESEELAQELIRATCAKQGIQPGQLTLHADNGSAMIAKSVAQLLIDLDVVKSHSRPHVSDDNPYSEAQFKTLKYRPDYPERFGCLVEARAWAHTFFTWYNDDHHHTGLGLMTPVVVHSGQAETVLQKRQHVLDIAYVAHPERFVKHAPVPAQLPVAVWINPPKPAGDTAAPLQ
jgi:transposase InsO family protein